MKLVKRICIFLMMFWSVGFLLTLAVQAFAHTLFDIRFHKVEAGQGVAVEAGQRLNVYVASLGNVPDTEILKPQVSITGSNEAVLSIEPFSFGMTRPGEGSEVINAHALYSVVSAEPQELVIDWQNPVDGYFLAVSNSLMISTVAFFSLIFFSVVGAALLYAAFGERVLRRLTIVPPAQEQRSEG